jgi:aryl-phospho-beta-D-glucosidase BglC (GH1 family)
MISRIRKIALIAAALIITLPLSAANTPNAKDTTNAVNTANVTNTADAKDESATSTAASVERKGLTEMDFLKANGRDLRNNSGQGDAVVLRGTNVGGYLLQEFWMTPTAQSSRVYAESDVYTVLEERFGEETMHELIDLYQSAYFIEKDFDNCAALGMNCLRLPFWWRNLTDKDGNFYKDGKGFDRLDWFIEEAGKRGMYVILDMHGAPGSQSGSDHSGVDGKDKKEEASRFFFGDEAAANQEIFYRIWEAIAARYKDNPAVAGYDLINEPFCTYRYNSSLGADGLHKLLWPIYDNAYKRIRAIDPDHIIIMEATWDPVDLPKPKDYGWTNIMYEYHNYAQGTINNLNDSDAVVNHMRKKLHLIVNVPYDVPFLMGEFTFYGNTETWEKGLELFDRYGVSWTSWTYKVTPGNGNWGLYHHMRTAGKINLETASLEDIQKAWQNVGNSVKNTQLTNLISKFF